MSDAATPGPDIRFYHLQRQALEQALPRLLAKAHEGGWRTLVRVGSEDRAEHLCDVLWTFDEASFLPHGTARDGARARQPILLQADALGGAAPVNGARLLVLTDGTEESDLDPFERVCDIFDGRDASALAAARQRWAAHRQAGRHPSYWQQDERGGWTRKAG